jgi:hypothetical protein
MRQFIISAVVVMLSATSALAQTTTASTSTAVAAAKHRAAPAPLLGAGLPALAICAGYGVYCLMRRRRLRAD